MGESGEQQARAFLTNHGLVILDQNVRVKNTEIDIIAWDPQYQEIIFVEVKTRQSDNFGDPSRAVNYRKLRAMQRVAQVYLTQHHLKNDFRFDIISILPNRIDHYQNVTW